MHILKHEFTNLINAVLYCKNSPDPDFFSCN